MAGEYTVNFTDPSKGSFTIDPNTIDGPGNANENTPLQLHGRFVVNYGEIVATNFVQLLENFASNTAPTVTTSGMLWFDISGVPTGGGTPIVGGLLKVRNTANDEWIDVGSGIGGAGGGAGAPPDLAPAGNFTAVAGENYFVDTSSGTVTATLPASPNVGDVVGFCDVAGTFNTDSFSVNGNGELIMGDPSVMVNNVQYSHFRLAYSGSTHGWRLFG